MNDSGRKPVGKKRFDYQSPTLREEAMTKPADEWTAPKLNRKQIHTLKQYAKFVDEEYRYPFNCGDSSVRASTCFALYRRGMLKASTEPGDWVSFRITEAGRKLQCDGLPRFGRSARR